MIKVLLVDDHVLVRQGLCHMLREEPDICIIGEASTGQEAIQMVRSLEPDVVLLELKLPDISGLEVTNRLVQQNPHAKILILSSVSGDLFPFRLLEAGALGYLTKESSKTELIDAIHGVFAGKHMISPTIVNQLALSKITPQSEELFATLSDRELEVALLTVRNTPIKEIAEKLHVSGKTVHSYRSRIFEKLHVKNDVGLTLLAIKHGFITIDE